ncbi:hypothetical protein BWD12_10700 [Leptospira santarosai serovar Bananal]|nr:hypothetical protein BWD11_02780 [Leptospira santarosai serovar Grippotyphosa]ONF78752.1 hypothetical protein BWD12_10700 [Leptospira santarosai serovar Bananal]
MKLLSINRSLRAEPTERSLESEVLSSDSLSFYQSIFNFGTRCKLKNHFKFSLVPLRTDGRDSFLEILNLKLF